jgi:hypothetical protein
VFVPDIHALQIALDLGVFGQGVAEGATLPGVYDVHARGVIKGDGAGDVDPVTPTLPTNQDIPAEAGSVKLCWLSPVFVQVPLMESSLSFFVSAAA